MHIFQRGAKIHLFLCNQLTHWVIVGGMPCVLYHDRQLGMHRDKLMPTLQECQSIGNPG